MQFHVIDTDSDSLPAPSDTHRDAGTMSPGSGLR